MSNVQLSIIVCTYNREKYLLRTLQHLAKQNSDHSKWEVIIVNNNSSDNTNQIVKDFIDNHSKLNFKSFLEKKQGLTHARNRGIRESLGKIIAFLDDDAFVMKDYSDKVISFFNNHDDAIALGGKIIPIYEGKKPEWMSKFLFPLVAALDMGDKIKLFKGNKFPIGANMAFRAETFEKYGLFDPKLGRKASLLEGGEEKDIFHRLKRNKEKFYYDPNVVVKHIIPEKRIEDNYIKKLAVGVGTSEKKRLSGKPLSSKINRTLLELIKIAATVILFFYFILLFKPSKSMMLVKFRIWVLKGFFL